MVDSGDDDAAIAQVRTALSLAARAYLLSIGKFPMSRAELPAQLEAADRSSVAVALAACIHDEPPLDILRRSVDQGLALLNGERVTSV